MEKAATPLSDSSTSPVHVYVVAPATLAEGYTFEATVQGFDNCTFTVEVVSLLNSQNYFIIS